MPGKKKPEKLSAALAKILAQRGWASRLKEYRVLGKWQGMVGEAIARHTRPVALRGKKLAVAVDSPAWMQQLMLLKPQLLESINRHLGAGAVSDITFRIGEIPLPAAAAAGDVAPVLLPELDEAAQRAIAEYVAAVKDPEIREALRRLIAKDLARKNRSARG